MAYLKLDPIVDVVVSTAAPVAPRDGFNVGLIVGKTVATGMSASNRTLVVTDLAEMISAGYTVNSPEYKAATLYFGQTPRPAKLVLALCVGTTVSETTTYETWVEAITAARAANSEWYAVHVADSAPLSSADIQAIAAYVETITAVFFYEDATAADITNATTDVFSVLKGLGYKRSFGLYSATPYAAAAAMGFAMGANDGTGNSAYTMAFKSLTGVVPDDLDNTQVGYLADKNANYYVTRAGMYKVLENGVCASGDWFDEVIGLDQLAYNIQRNCMDVLQRTRTKVPYTDAGALQFVLACNDACKTARDTGFLAAGLWSGGTVLDLQDGFMLTAGYLCQSEPIANRPSTEKALRKCPPIYCCINLAGAIHSVTIKVNVQ